MIIKDQFNQTLTKAAFIVLQELDNEIAQLEHLANQENTSDPAEEALAEQHEIFSASYTLKANLLRVAKESLQRDVEQQTFDY